MSADHGSCPSCGADLNGTSIWQTFYDMSRENGYYEHKSAMTHEEAEAQADKISANYGATRTHGVWGRAIGLSDGDSVHDWKCPDCGHEWPRRSRT